VQWLLCLMQSELLMQKITYLYSYLPSQ